MKKLFLLFIFLTLSFNIANAQIFLEQAKIMVSAEPGTAQSGTIDVHNTSDKELNLKVYWEDFNYVAPFQGSKEFLAKGQGDYSAAEIITFSPDTVKIAPFTKKNISYSVSIPESFDKGRYGVLFFENAPEAGEIEGKGVNIVTRVGSLFFVEPTDKNKTFQITDLNAAGTNVTGKITNQGNVIIIAHPIYYAMTNDGEIVDRGELENFYLPPTKTADFSIPLKATATEFILVLTFDLQDDDSVVKEITIANSGSSFQVMKISD